MPDDQEELRAKKGYAEEAARLDQSRVHALAEHPSALTTEQLRQRQEQLGLRRRRGPELEQPEPSKPPEVEPTEPAEPPS